MDQNDDTPITRADLKAMIVALRRTRRTLKTNYGQMAFCPNDEVANALDIWLAESAPVGLPSVTEYSQAVRESRVEAISDQPTDIAEWLEGDASAWEEAAKAADEYDNAPAGMRETAALEREAAAEIRRLREQVAARKGG